MIIDINKVMDKAKEKATKEAFKKAFNETINSEVSAVAEKAAKMWVDTNLKELEEKTSLAMKNKVAALVEKASKKVELVVDIDIYTD